MKEKFYVTEELKKFRIERGLSRKRLSTKCGLSSKTIQRAENGEKIMLKSIEKIAKGLKIDKQELIDFL